MAKTIEVAEVDLTRMKIVLTALRNGKWVLEGQEVLAFAQGFQWLTELHGRVKAGLDAPETPAVTEGPKAT